MSVTAIVFSIFFCVVLVALVAVVPLYNYWSKASEEAEGNLVVVPKKFVTGNELEFYHRLRRACGTDFVVMTQVSMAALIDTELKQEHPRYWEIRRLYSGRICDYVLCNPKTLKPALVVELDDKMHDFNRDSKRDVFLAQAGIPSLRFWSRDKLSEESLRKYILSKTAKVAGLRV